MSLRALVMLVLAAITFPMVASVTVVSHDDKNFPVSKVVTMLKDMLNQLQKEGEDDQDVYDKMSCWCETNDKEKTQAIKDAEARIEVLTTTIAQTSAKSSQLQAEIEIAAAEVKDNQDALDQATALREKQLASFNSEEKELLESIMALKQAIVVLGKHHGQGFLQVPRSHVMGVAATLEHELNTHGQLLAGVLSPSERRAISAFIQQPSFDSAPTFKQSYAPQSGQIFGILRQMKESFEANLANSQGEEKANSKAYGELKAAKEEEISAGQQQVDTKTAELADTDKKHADAKQDIADTKASLSADEQFLMMLKEKCQVTDQEWGERQKTRASEIEAVSQAISILSTDDAHSSFSKTFNAGAASLLQERTMSQQRGRASELLAAVARREQNPKLAALAAQVRLSPFTRVKKAIDDMVTVLLKEGEDEVKKRDFCINQMNENEAEQAKTKHEQSGLKADIESLDSQIGTLDEAITQLNTEIADLQTEMKKAGETRDAANKDFQATVADQRETQGLLKQAIDVLRKAYPAMVQVKKSAQQGPPPPAGFKTYEKNAASGGVVGLIQQILADAEKLEAESTRAEQEEQAAYETYVTETNGSIAAKEREKTNKSESRAKKQQALVEAQKDKDSVDVALEELTNTDAELHNDCDFTLDNFDLRQAARAEEVKALREAKAILSGKDLQSSMA